MTVPPSSPRAQLLRDLEELVLAEGFLALSMDDLAHRLHCSKATLYSVAGNKEQLVVALTKGFFRQATEQIEQAVAEVADPGYAFRLTCRGSAGR